MRNHLYGTATIVAASFFRENGPVYFSGCDVTLFGETLVDKTFIVSQIKVGFRTVIGNEYFAVLNWVHGARINVDIRIKFLHRDTVTSHFQKSS